MWLKSCLSDNCGPRGRSRAPRGPGGWEEPPLHRPLRQCSLRPSPRPRLFLSWKEAFCANNVGRFVVSFFFLVEKKTVIGWSDTFLPPEIWGPGGTWLSPSVLDEHAWGADRAPE